MGKFEALIKCAMSVFGTNSWKAENIATFPSNFTGSVASNKYIRVHVIPSGLGVNLKSSSGQVLIDIFTPAGSGPLEVAQIADKLDAYLVGKSYSNSGGVIQLFNSSLQHRGFDSANPALHRSVYAIPFNFSGV
jgi:hypothetical protein